MNAKVFVSPHNLITAAQARCEECDWTFSPTPHPNSRRREYEAALAEVKRHNADYHEDAS